MRFGRTPAFAAVAASALGEEKYRIDDASNMSTCCRERRIDTYNRWKCLDAGLGKVD